MTHVSSSFKVVAIGLLVAAAIGCQNQTQPEPLAPSASPPAASPAPSGPSTAPSTPPAVFRDDFNGNTLDMALWIEHRRTGVVQVADGVLEMVNSRNQGNYPYLVARPAVLPTSGPTFAEISFKVVSPGPIAFSLDYMPPENPEDRPITEPFLRTTWVDNTFGIQVNLERETVAKSLPGALDTGKFHVLRYENDGSGKSRVIWDGAEVAVFETRLRPTRFWIGSHPIATGAARVWPRVQVDHVALGVMSAPATATPLAAPAQSPSPSPSASPSP